jgi:hypothetical protein
MSRELDITLFVDEYGDRMEMFAQSVADSGLDNIGQITWRNAVAVSDGSSVVHPWYGSEETLVDHRATASGERARG